MDSTAIGIAAGLVLTTTYTLIRALRQKSFDFGSTCLVFLTVVAIPGGAQLIRASILGNPAALPSLWREYVAVAGLAAIGLPAQYVIQSFRNVWTKRIKVIPVTGQLNATVQADEIDIQFARSDSQEKQIKR